jgi:hypothetical protein
MLEATKHIAADSTKGEFSIAKMKADYEAMIQASAKGGAGGAKLDLTTGAGRKTAAEMGTKIASHVALKAVREPLGPFNWVLFGPSEAGKELQFINAGSLSINGARARALASRHPRRPCASLSLSLSLARPHTLPPRTPAHAPRPRRVRQVAQGRRKLLRPLAHGLWRGPLPPHKVCVRGRRARERALRSPRALTPARAPRRARPRAGIFFTFSGPKVGVVKRSKAASAKTHMKAALGPVSIDLQVTSLDELTLKDVIDKVRKLPGVEGASRGAGRARGLSADALLTPPPRSSHTRARVQASR